MRASSMSVTGSGVMRQALEIGRVLHIGRTAVPAIGLAALDGDPCQLLVALEHVGVAAEEHLRRDHLADDVGDFLVGRPDVLEIDRLAVAAGAERLGGDVDVERAGERIGDDQRRRGEVVGPHVGVHAAFEIAVARQHRGGDEIVVVDAFGDRGRQRPGIADAGGAAIAHEVEAERVEIGLRPAALR